MHELILQLNSLLLFGLSQKFKFKFFSDDDENVPSFFYIIKACTEMSFVLIKLAFLGDVDFTVRTMVCICYF